MKIDPAEKSKIYVLLAACVLVFAFGAVQMGALRGSQPQTAPSGSPGGIDSGTTPAVTDAGGAQTATPASTDVAIVIPKNEPVPNIDAFRDVLSRLPKVRLPSNGSLPWSQRAETPKPRPTNVSRPTKLFGGGFEAPSPLPGALPLRVPGMGQVPVQGQLSAIQNVPAMTLRGVMTGADPVAVIGAAGHTQVLHLGERTPDAYQLVKVTSNAATLTRGSEKVILRFGIK